MVVALVVFSWSPLLEPLAAQSDDPITWLINLGVAGIVIVLLITGQLRTKAEVDHLLSEIAAKDRVIEAVQTQLLSNTLPALAHSTRVMEAVPANEQALVEQLQRTQEEAKALIGRMERLARGGGP